MSTLFKEFTLNHGAVLRNRFCLAPMTTYSANDDLTLSCEEEVYYESRSKELGMVITAACAVNKNAQAFPYQISARDSRYLDSLERLAKAIKKGGAKAILQLHHGGRMNVPDLYANQDIVSASAIKANRDYCVTPRELNNSEVYDIIDDFIEAIILAIKAGFDGIELHGANTYLIQQFFSANSNHRTDEFGGDNFKRLKFPLLLVKRAINTAKLYAKEDFIIGYRFSPEEVEEDGITLNHTFLLVDELSNMDIDYLHISLGSYKQTSLRNPNDTVPIIKKIHNIINGRVPLIGVGGIETFDDAREALHLGSDLIALGKITLSDPDIVSKMKNHQLPNKIISSQSLLPKPLFERLKKWDLEKTGYKIIE